MTIRVIVLVGTMLSSAGPTFGQVPLTDPTLLTTQALEKSIAALRELMDAKMRAIEKEAEFQKGTLDHTDARLIVRLDAIDSVIEKQVIHLQRLMEEKFKGVDQQFQGRDVALAAALLAQKTSVDEQNKANAASSAKAEGATTKQIDGIQSIIQASSRATDDKFDSMKALLASQSKTTDDKIADLRSTIADLRTSIRISDTAITTRTTTQSDVWAIFIGVVGMLIGIAGVIVAVFRFRHERVP